MPDRAVSWRRALAIVVGVALSVTGIVFVLRSDGFSPSSANVPRATRWFVDGTSGFAVLADGFAGRTLARVKAGDEGAVLGVAQGPAGAAVYDRTDSTSREIDQRALRPGQPRVVDVLGSTGAIVGFSQAGFVAVDPVTGDAQLVPSGGDTVPFEVPGAGGETLVAPDGSVWTVDGARLVRVTTTGVTTVLAGAPGLRFSLVGNEPLVFDPDGARVRLGSGEWVALPVSIDESEVVLQEPGPASTCGWVAVNDDLWCFGDDEIVRSSTIPGLDVDGSDRLAIAGDAAALLRTRPRSIVRLDWRAGREIDGGPTVPPTADLEIAVTADMIWVDDTAGDVVWAINPWGLHAITKDRGLEFGETGDVIDDGGVGDIELLPNGNPVSEAELEPDGDDVDDPPVAVDDPVTARTGKPVRIAVTANDYDPDGEAIALVGIGPTTASGVAEITDASTVLYTPTDNQVGLDTFEYTIADGNGTEDTGEVLIDLLPLDGPNQAPVGSDDATETGPGRPVVIDVLANDIDPERDSLLISSFVEPGEGELVEIDAGPSGFPALRYTPPETGGSSVVTFEYRPGDFLGAIGETVEVTVTIGAGEENRPPVARPDAIRVRPNFPRTIAVTNNDRDPDGDILLVSVVEATVPDGLELEVQGNAIGVVARAGADEFLPFQYRVVDQRGGEAFGSVLVVVLDDAAPNSPPVANDDNEDAIAGETKLLEVLANDYDPDGDDVFLESVSRVDGTGGDIRVVGDRVQYTPPPLGSDDEGSDRFRYTITDGNGESATAEVRVVIRPEAPASRPYATPDQVSTYVDEPITFDPVINDGDPSGDRPILARDPSCGAGRAVVTPDGDVTFTPPVGRTGTYVCDYEIVNASDQRATSQIIVSVGTRPSSNERPVVPDRSRQVRVNGTLEIDLLDGVTDDGSRSELRVVDVERVSPTFGRVDWSGSTLTFTAGPNPDRLTIRFSVEDGDGGVTVGRVNIEIVAEERPAEAPIPGRDSAQVPTPVPGYRIDVLQNDVDPDGDPESLRIVSATVTAGQATVEHESPDLVFTFFDPTYVGPVRAQYVVEDTDGLRATGDVVITLTEPPNQPPIARGENGSVDSGGVLTLDLSSNDTDPEGARLTYAIVTPPASGFGTADLTTGGVLTFRAGTGGGIARIAYRVSDGDLTADAVATIEVRACRDANPEAQSTTVFTGYQVPITVDLRARASAPIVDAQLTKGQGSLTRSPDLATVTYTPPAGFNGNAEVTYRVLNSCNVEAIGRITIDVNQDPTGLVVQQSLGRRATLTIPISELGSDVDGPLTITRLSGAPPWLTASADGKSLFANPNGSAQNADRTEVELTDVGGLTATATVTITLENTRPVAVGDTVTIASGSVTFQPLANDSDPDGDAVSLLAFPGTINFPNGGTGSVTAAGGGSLRVDAGTGTGTGTFTYTIADALGAASAPATVTVVVNRPPAANNLTVEIEAGPPVSFALPVSDPDGNPLTVELLDPSAPFVTSVSGATVTAQIPRIWRPPLEVGVRYRVTDSAGASATATLTLVLVDTRGG